MAGMASLKRTHPAISVYMSIISYGSAFPCCPWSSLDVKPRRKWCWCALQTLYSTVCMLWALRRNGRGKWSCEAQQRTASPETLHGTWKTKNGAEDTLSAGTLQGTSWPLKPLCHRRPLSHKTSLTYLLHYYTHTGQSDWYMIKIKKSE